MTQPERSPRSIRRNFSSSLIGQVVYAASQFAMLSVLSHSANPRVVGSYALALAIMAPLYTLIEMRLRLVKATDARGRFQFSAYFGHRIVAVLVPVASVGLYGAIIADIGFEFAILFAVTVYKAFESLLDIAYGAMARAERLDMTRRSLVWRSLGNVLIFSLVVLPTQRVDIAYLLMAAYNLLCLFAALRHVKQLGHTTLPAWHWKSLWKLSLVGFPLGLSFALGSLTVNVPRYVVQGHHGSEELAIFATAAYVLMAITTVINALAHATTPRLARYFEAREVAMFRRLLGRTLIVGLCAGCIGILSAWIFGGTFLRVAFGPEYGGGASTLFVLMLAAAFQYLVTFLRESFVAMRQYQLALPVSLTNMVTVTVACFALVPSYGTLGAAFSVLAGQLVAVGCFSTLFITRGRWALKARA